MASETALLESTRKQLYVGGEWRPASGDAQLSVEDPATRQTLTDVPDASEDDALAALAAAEVAQADWRDTAPRERSEILRRGVELLSQRTDDLALLMTLEMGKPLEDSKSEITYSAEFLRWFAGEAVRISGEFMRAPNGQGRILTTRQPVGPSLLITPWNFPMAMGARKIAPAIAAGCTMVVKPAHQTPLSMLALTGILEEAGLPPGVLNVVTTSKSPGVVGALMSDRRLRKVSFTGSTEVGRKLMAQASENLLRISLELGGNAPFIVFDDAHLDVAVEGAVKAKMRNMGEACTAANRMYVAEPVATEFARRLADRLSGMEVGRGTEPGVEVGPLIDGKALEKVERLVDDAASKGARVCTGGGRIDGKGYFFAPTVLADVPDDADLLREEIFGPVAPIVPFATEEEALQRANDTDYGLLAYVFTENLDRALRVAEALESGMVAVNRGVISDPAAPFGGVKHSGIGREGGFVGIDEFLETKYIGLP